MDSRTALFQQHRPRLFGLAYRMLGTPADAEDVLHDTWLRWHAQDTDALDDAEAWLVTVTTRLSLDRLRRAKTERAHYTGPWLPEPLIAESEQPEAQLEKSESLTLTFLLLLERLSAEERAAFLLHEVFDYSHAEAARILDISAVACRQRVHRARTRVRQNRPRFTVDTQKQQRMLERFTEALQHPTIESLRALFAEDVIHIADGGGVVQATLRPLRGADRLARFYMQVTQQTSHMSLRHSMFTLNGQPALLTWLGDKLLTALWVECNEEHIVAMHALRHPDKLARLAKAASASSFAIVAAAVTTSATGTSLH